MAASANRLENLKNRQKKKEDELTKLRVAIDAEEKKVKEKERKDNEKWWREVSREAEKVLTAKYGPDYKKLINKSDLVSFISTGILLAPDEPDAAENQEDLQEDLQEETEYGRNQFEGYQG